MAYQPNFRPALLLNADYQPLSYFPLSVMSWQDAIRAVFLDRVRVISHYDQEVRSPGFTMNLPSVVALKDYIPIKGAPPFTRFNLFLRDKFTCQYTGQKLPAEDLTFDHVIPRSKGGETSWENIVTASRQANLRKGNMLPHECGMYPRVKPKQPTIHELRQNGRHFPPDFLHESWRDFLYWDVKLEN